MSVIASQLPKLLLIQTLPLVVIGVDPDSDHTAIAVLTRDPSDLVFRVAEVDGGGRGAEPVPWGDVIGATAVLVSWLAWASRAAGNATRLAATRVHVAVEAQLASGGAHSSDVEGCRRARWHWDAASTTLAVPCSHIDPGAWQPRVGADGRPLAASEVKAEYRRRARELDTRASNEDRAAAVGLAVYQIGKLGGMVR